MVSINAEDLGRVLQAEYDYRYKANDGHLVTIDVGEEFILIKKSNDDWWQVIKLGQKKPFYIPATYMKELNKHVYPDHPFFKKAYTNLQKLKKKQRSSDKVKQTSESERPSSEEVAQKQDQLQSNSGSREDLSGLSSKSKLSMLRASCDSLDHFIENENPYDEVPFESSISLPKSNNTGSKLSVGKRYEEPGYENLESFSRREPLSEETSLPPSTKKEQENAVPPETGKHDTNFSGAEVISYQPRTPIYSSIGGEGGFESRLAADEPTSSTTAVEVLDDNWEVQLDHQTNSKYYLNKDTGEMRMKPPRRKPRSASSNEFDDNLSASRVVPPAVPDASKKPVLERLADAQTDETLNVNLERRKTSPARLDSVSSNKDQETHAEATSHGRDSKVLPSNKSYSRGEVFDKDSSMDGKSSSLEKPTSQPEKKKRKEKHKKTKSDSSVLDQSKSSLSSLSSSPSQSVNETQSTISLGWKRERTHEGDIVYVRKSNGDRWHQMFDNQSGSYYYFNEISNETSWELPMLDLHETDETMTNEDRNISEDFGDPDDMLLSKCPQRDGLTIRKANTLERSTVAPDKRDLGKNSSLPHATTPPPVSPKPKSGRGFKRQVDRVIQARSMIVLSDVDPQKMPFEDTHQLEQFHCSRAGDLKDAPLPYPMIEMQGRLNWTKLMEAGKKLRKNWVQQWVVLLANNLLFYKDQKQATMTKDSPHGRPDSSCDLRGAKIEWSKDKSSKKNVIELHTLRGLLLLLQHDDLTVVHKWLNAIKANIQGKQYEPVDDVFSQKPVLDDEEEEIETKKKKDKKKKNKYASRHDSDLKNADRVRTKLKKFINRRPTVESLQERGIIKETVFGCPLDKLCAKEQTTVPMFVRRCVEEVENRGLDVDGIYRVSGNLSHIQKLRYLVDGVEAFDLGDAEWEDIHLITGALKMFLRELPEPVIPFNFFDKFISACKLQDDIRRINAMRDLVAVLPKPNKDTLKYLMKHFCKVVEHSSSNRMQAQNIAIVFGPTLLLKPPDESKTNEMTTSGHMAIYMVYQNQIIDTMLMEYHTIFGK